MRSCWVTENPDFWSATLQDGESSPANAACAAAGVLEPLSPLPLNVSDDRLCAKLNLVGELVPKRIALNSPERIAARVAPPMRLLSTAAGPLVSLLTLSTDVVLRLLQVRPSQEAAVSEEEVRVLIAQGTEAGVFEEAERDLVESAFDLARHASRR